MTAVGWRRPIIGRISSSPAGEGWLATADSSGALERQASSFKWDNHAILVR